MDIGRLVAAEKNALAAIQVASQSSRLISDLTIKVTKIEAENIQLRNELTILKAQLYGMMGNAATQR